MSWATQYIGMPYVAEDGDCATLATLVAREQLGLRIDLPQHAKGLRAQAKQFVDLKDGFAERVGTPQDKHPILFLSRGKFYHLGVAMVSRQTWVLHADQLAGQVRCVPLTDMAVHYTVEGFYKWRRPH